MNWLGHPESVVAKAPKQTAILAGFGGLVMAVTTMLAWMAGERLPLIAIPIGATVIALLVTTQAIVRLVTHHMPN